MKKIITILSVLMCMTVACSDDEDTKDYPELPDRDLDISVPVVPADWEPGMAYKPYEDDMPEPLNVDVHVLVVGEGEQLENVLHVLNNEAWLWGFELFGKEVEKKENVRQCFFPNHENICIHTMKSIMDLGSDDVKYDIILFTTPVEDMATAELCEKQLKEKCDKYPMVIVPAGDYEGSSFSNKAWDFCKQVGGVNWERDVLPNFPEWGEVGEFLTDEQKVYYHPGNVAAAYAVKEGGHAWTYEWVIVGGSDGYGNVYGTTPGEVFQYNSMCAPFSFNVNDAQVKSTELSAAYVAKIAAEVKRRLPHYTASELSEIILSNVDYIGAFASYGYGMINPKTLWGVVKTKEMPANETN